MARDDYRIVQLASVARSGETLFLRQFSAHPRVHVVHDLLPGNTDAETRLFQLLRVWPARRIPRAAVHALTGPLPAGTSHLLLKQGVFTPLHAWRGLVLLRNPYAVFSSLWTYDARMKRLPDDAALHAHHWATLRLPRLLAWMDAIDPALTPVLQQLGQPLEQFMLFYETRVRQLQASGQPLLHYEDLVREPEAALDWAAHALGLPPDPAVHRAHERHPRGATGHGGIRLDAPIHCDGRDWQALPGLATAPFEALCAALRLDRYAGLYTQQPSADVPPPQAQEAREVRVPVAA